MGGVSLPGLPELSPAAKTFWRIFRCNAASDSSNFHHFFVWERSIEIVAGAK